MNLRILVALALASTGCAAAVAPDDTTTDGRAGAPEPALAGPVAASPAVAPSAADSGDTPQLTFACVAPRRAPDLGADVCTRRVVIHYFEGTACYEGALSGELRYACDGGPAIVAFGDRTLYGAVEGDHLSVCGSNRFTLHDDDTCADGPAWMSGVIALEGPLAGPLAMRWEAISLSSDARCQHTTCNGAGMVNVEMKP